MTEQLYRLVPFKDGMKVPAGTWTVQGDIEHGGLQFFVPVGIPGDVLFLEKPAFPFFTLLIIACAAIIAGFYMGVVNLQPKKLEIARLNGEIKGKCYAISKYDPAGYEKIKDICEEKP